MESEFKLRSAHAQETTTHKSQLTQIWREISQVIDKLIINYIQHFHNFPNRLIIRHRVLKIVFKVFTYV